MLRSKLYIKKGKRAVLLLHAYTGSPSDVRMLARSLERKNYTVLAPLLSGHGTMEPIDILSVTPDTWQLDVEKAVKQLRNDGYNDIAVFGLSLGGIYAMSLLEKYPDFFVGGGTFCSPLIRTKNNHIYPSFLDYCQFMYSKSSYSEDEIKTKMNVVKELLTNQLDLILEKSNEIYQKVHLIEQPVFLAQAAKDEMIDVNGVYELATALNKTNHEIHWYKNSTHVITVSKDRHLFEADVHHFLSQLSWNED